MRALRDRPTALERWPKRRSPRHQARDRPTRREGRRVLSEAGPQRRARLPAERGRRRSPRAGWPPRSARPRSPCPSVCADGHAHVPPVAGPPTDVDRPDELRIDLDPQPGTSPPTPPGSPGWPRSCSTSSAWSASRVGQPRRAHLRAHPARVGVRRRPARGDRVRPGPGTARRRRHHEVVEGGTRRAGVRRLQPELPGPHDRLGLLAAPDPRRPGEHPQTWAELAETTDPAAFTLFTVPDRLADGDPWAAIDDVANSLEPLLRLDQESGGGEMPYPPDYPKMPGEPPRVQPSKKVEANWTEDGRRREPEPR